MNQFPPNIDPQLYTLSASLVGYALVPYFTADELNSIGNWLMSVGQYLETASVQTILIQGRQKRAESYNEYVRNKKTSYDLQMLNTVISKMQEEIERLSKLYNK